MRINKTSMKNLFSTKKIVLLGVLMLIAGGVAHVAWTHAEAAICITCDSDGGGGGGPSPVNGVCASTHYSCSAGTSANNVAGSTTWTWSCLGLNGGTTANCSENMVINGVCAATHYNCTAGTSAGGYISGAVYYWSCNGINGGTNASCYAYDPINGVCDNTTAYACSVGTAINQAAGTYFTWNCQGYNGGTTDSCSKYRSVSWATISASPNPVACGGTATLSWASGPNATMCEIKKGSPGVDWYAGGPSGSLTVYPDYYSGYCQNTVDPALEYFAGSGVNITQSALNGACGGSAYACNAGTSANNANNGSYYTWNCNGACGGTNASCSLGITPTVSISAAATSIAYGAATTINWSSANASSCSLTKAGAAWTSGTSGSASTGALYASTAFGITCSNAYTSASASVTVTVAPLNGACAATAYNCAAGTSGSNVFNNTTGVYTWMCNGANGGTNASCSQTIPPVVSVTPHTANGGTTGYGYDGETASITWTATYSPSSCTVYKNGASYASVAGTATSNNTAPLVTGTQTYRVDCANAGGTGTGNTVTFSVPLVPTGLSVSCPNPGSTANFSWTLPSGITSTYFRYYTTPPSSIDYNSACNPAKTPPNGSCITVNGSSVGQATTPGNQYYWYIHSRDAYGNWSPPVGGGAFSCAVNGVCSTTVINGCNAGAFVDVADNASYNYWYCQGLGGGTNSATCAIAKVNGVCSTTHYACTTGTSVSNVSGPTQWTWTCNGANNGTNASCSETKPAPNAPTIGGPTQGQVNTSYTFTFKASNPSGDDIRYAIDWDNNGTIDQYLPATGYTTQNTQLSTPNNWAGSGVKTFKARTETNGGPVSGWTTYSITIYGIPTVTWTPGASATIPYNGTLSFGYTSTDATSCSYYDLNPSTGAIQSTIWSNGATSSSWTNAGPYQADFRRKVVCQNPFSQTGSAEIYVTVQQNNAACGTFSIPNYVTPGQIFSGTITMVNNGTNPWLMTGNSATPHRLGSQNPQDNSMWGTNRVNLSANVPAGGTGTFTTNFTATSTEGAYPFSWRMVEETVQWFGPTCDPTTASGTKIIVMNPKLAVQPANYGFPDQVAGDPAQTMLLHVSNLGGGNITGGNITGFSGPFTCTSVCDFTLGPGETKDISISFAPSATGTYSTILHVNATGQASVDVSTYGNGVEKLVVSTDPSATVSTNPLDFGDAPTTRPKYLNFNIKNQSLSQSGGTVSGITTTNPVFTCFSGCSFTLPPSTSSTPSVAKIRMQFLPTALGTATGQMTIGTTPPVTIDLTGVGVKPQFTTEEK